MGQVHVLVSLERPTDPSSTHVLDEDRGRRTGPGGGGKQLVVRPIAVDGQRSPVLELPCISRDAPKNVSSNPEHLEKNSPSHSDHLHPTRGNVTLRRWYPCAARAREQIGGAHTTSTRI